MCPKGRLRKLSYRRPFTEDQIKSYFRSLKVIFYAAGSVRYFAEPFLKSGVRVISGWQLISLSVAEFSVSLIVLALRGAFLTLEAYKKNGYACARNMTDNGYPGIYGSKVGVLGAGAIGSHVIKLLKLEKVFSRCHSITNHLADNKKTAGMLDYRLFSMMKDTASFVNTGRGAQVVEDDLIKALKEKPGRVAVMDVTYPEPVRPGHKFLSMPNVFLFPHIAGKAAMDSLRPTDGMIDQLKKYMAGEPLDYEVTLDMLETMA